MLDKFSYQNLIITLIPGGFFISMLLLTFPYAFSGFSAKLPDQDFLLTFIFVAISLTAGEVIQTLARSLEGLIDFVFFKGYRPSELFLLPGNPVLAQRQCKKVLDQNIAPVDRDDLAEYSTVSLWKRMFCGKADFAAQSQQVFRQLYTKCNKSERVQESNARYLFVRGMFVVFLLVAAWFWYLGFLSADTVRIWHLLALISLFLSILFLYRARGCAKGLVSEVAFLSTT